uniref:Uncharacterized protein n=1 Tax=Anguilla anguilla TaxID=7936 RepID=A0A0E9XYN2_ANGAN
MIPNILLKQQIYFSKTKTEKLTPNLNKIEHDFHMLKRKLGN